LQTEIEALRNGNVFRAWAGRTETGALIRAVSLSPLLSGPSTFSNEKKERFP
jgi:hypothetical protein